MKDRLLACLLTLAAAFVSAQAVAADDQVPPEIVSSISRLADELNSPFCPGKTLLNCTSYQAYELRREMQDLAMSGLTDTQIVEKIQVRYKKPLTNPDQPLVSSILPLLPFIAGGLLVLFAMRKWKNQARKTAPDEDAAVDEEDAERLAQIRALVADPDEE